MLIPVRSSRRMEPTIADSLCEACLCFLGGAGVMTLTGGDGFRWGGRRDQKDYSEK